MNEIIVEYQGKKIKTTKEKLFSAALLGQVTPETKIWYEGKEYRCGYIKGIQFPEGTVKIIDAEQDKKSWLNLESGKEAEQRARKRLFKFFFLYPMYATGAFFILCLCGGIIRGCISAFQ